MKTLTKKFLFTVFAAFLAVSCLFLVNTAFSGKNVAKADTPTVTCSGVNQWNNNVLNGGYYITLLEYDIYLGDAANATNVVSTTGQGITLNGVKLSAISGAVVDYAHGKNRVEIKIPQSYQDALAGDIVLEVIAGTHFENQVLDGAKFTLLSAKWTKMASATFSDIRHNNVNYQTHCIDIGTTPANGIYVTLRFYESFGDTTDTTNLATEDYEIGTGLKINGVSIKDISGSFVDASAGSVNMHVYIPFTGLSEYKRAILTVDDGTAFRNKYINAFTVYFNGSSWTTTANTKTAVTFSNIQWNNTNYDATNFGGNGVLLNYNSNLSTVSGELNGGIPGVELKSYYGKYITLNGETLDNIANAELRYHSLGKLWIYAPGMTAWNGHIPTIEIAANAPFLDAYLPALTLYWNGSAWQTSNPRRAVNFSTIAWNNLNYDTANLGGGANGVLLRYDANLSLNASEINGGIKTVELKSLYGSYITLNGQTLNNIAGAELRYHSQGNLWIYAPGMTAWNGHIPTIEIAANAPFSFSYLPALTLYWNGSAWQTSSPRRAVGFSRIRWNNLNYGVSELGGGAAGLLLEYDANLSLVANEINGNIKSTELKSLYGSYITLNGQTLNNIAGAELRYHSQGNLWIYAPGMTSRDGTSAKIEIAANAPFSYSYLPALTLFWNGSNAWQVAEPNPTFSAAVNSWTNQGWFIAQFNTGAWTHDKVPTSYTGIKYNGNNITDLCTNVKFYLTNGLWFVYSASDAKLAANYNGYSHPTIEIEENATVVYDGFTTTLPAMKFYYVNGAWQTTEPDGYFDHMVDFVSVQHNNVNYGTHSIDIGTTPANGIYATLKFSESFGAAADSTNYATNSYSIGTGLKINGVSIKNISGAFVDAAHGNTYMSVYVPYTGLSEYKRATLTVDAGTEFRGKYLNAFTVYFKGSSWRTSATEKTSVTFSNIQWNNINYDATNFGGAGVLLNYSANLSTVDSEINGGIPGAELKSYYGSYITINGQALNNVANSELRYHSQGKVWIYAPSMKTWAGHIPTIEIAASTPFLDAYLPALTIYYNSETSEWQLEEPEIEIPDLGTPDCDFTGFSTWNNTNGMTLLQFRSFVNIPTATAEYTSTTGYYITYNGTRLTEVSGAYVASWVGQCWLRVDIPNPAANSVLIIEEGTPFADNYLPKIVLKLVNGVWCTAFGVNITIDSDTYTVYSKDDVPVIINDEYLETLLSGRSIPAKAIGFEVRGVTYKAGTTFKALTDTDIEVIAIGFNTANGASVRLNNPTGIRFETRIDKGDYDALVARVGSANVETGTYILPRSFLTSTDFRSYFADNTKVSGTDYIKIVNHGFFNEETADTDGYYKFYGSLVNIKPNNYCTDFFGIGYIKITDGGNVYTVFGGYDIDDHTRTIYYVSSKSYANFGNGTSQKAVLKGYLDGVVYITDDAAISNITTIDGYSSPYSITYNSSTGVYTITGDAEIKSVMIDGKKKVSSRTSTLEISGSTKYVTDYSLSASAGSSTLTFKLSSVQSAASLVDFTIEVPSDRGVKILQLTDTEIIDALQMRTSGALTSAQQEEYARKNIYANCFNYITELVENDRPDLIIVTGDMINGNFDDNGTMFLRFIEFMDSLDIPWATVFGTLDNQSAKGASWQRTQLTSTAQHCLFKAGSVTGNGDYTIGITDGGVIKRVIYMLDSATNSGINSTQVNWVKTQAASIASAYGAVPGFICYNKDGATDFSSDFATANIDGVFKGNSYNNNSSTLTGGIYYTYGTKTGSYGTHNVNKVGGTYIALKANCQEFTITAQCLNKNDMKNKQSIHLVETYDNSSLVTDAYLAPVWDTDRIYDETGLFVGETGSVTLMYTPTTPSEVVVRNITLGVTYTYGIDYTISGKKVTRVAGGNLPYMSYDEYYRSTPVYIGESPQGFTVTPDGNGKAEDGYTIVGTKYLFFSEGFGGFKNYVTFTYDKTQAWTGTNFAGDANAQDFIDKLKDDKEATIFFYGDSITVGCNASGTEYGDYRNPNLPAWNDLVTDYLANLYGANITKYNGARGGWQTFEGAENFTSKVSECGTTLASIDLLVLAYGINDVDKTESTYITNIESMIDAYLAANPSGSVLLVSPMKPNSQSALVSGNGEGCETALNKIRNKAKYSSSNISVANVFTMFNELITVSGKLARDYLGNNINHPNDFGVRLYAQVILKTLCGDDFG